MEVDHKIQKSKGGADSYINLQLLHRHCHIIKTKNDLEKDLDKRFLEKESLGKASQELDEGKLSRPDRKTGLSRNRPL